MPKTEQRPIKFRAWSKRFNMMTDNPEANDEWISEWQPLNPVITSIQSDSDLILMQYTGLTDEQGTDIYEGDVVGDYVGEHKGQPVTASGSWQEVSWEGCGFNLDPTKSYRVVGNIYQSGDLLNAQD